jgi:hypothetical protein
VELAHVNFNFNSFEPSTFETFGAHCYRQAYREMIRAVCAARIGDCDSVRHLMGRADCYVSVLYDISHPRCYSVLTRYNAVKARLFV